MSKFVGRNVTVTKDSTSLEDQLRTKTITFNGELVDVTVAGDDGWTTTLDEVFATNNVTVQLEGLASTDLLPDMAFSGSQEAFTIVVDELFELTGTWQFQAGFAIGAPHDGEATVSGTLQSVGEVTKAPVST